MDDLDRDLNNALDAILWLLDDLNDVGNEDELYDLWCVLEDAKAEIEKVKKARKYHEPLLP